MDDRLEQIILHIIDQKPRTLAEFERARRKTAKKLKTQQPRNSALLGVYKRLVKERKIRRNKHIEYFLRKVKIRTLSGIAIVASLTKPYQCPGKCIYCPKEANMPKSYIATEPAAARALQLHFDPYNQMKERILMLEKNGHQTGKIEFIVKGGTWNAYPLNYQYWFIKESFRACNDLSRRKRSCKLGQNISLKKLKKVLAEEQRYNETAKHRIIGLTLETRPDAVTPKTILQMREQGCTRVELGLQAPDDKILKLIKRGHTLEQFYSAMFLLRQAGFKVDIHFMPSLPGSSPKHDVLMYKNLFSDPRIKPDMIKIYPCVVIENTELYDWFKKGKYKTYPYEKLFEALIKMKSATPRYCRISRLIRDIPAQHIITGNKITNLRDYLKEEMEKRGIRCKCLRCCEIGHQDIELQRKSIQKKPKLFIDSYKTRGGTEYFLSFCLNDNRNVVFSFLRLRLPDKKITEDKEDKVYEMYGLLPQVKNAALIRELHTYGALINIGLREAEASQHKGLGKKLMQEAEKIAEKARYKKMVVISGVGVRGYYKKFGYRKSGTYMVKSLS